MSADIDSIIYETKRKMLAKYPRFGSEIATIKIIFRDDLKFHTAATDGKAIFVDPNYFASLNDEEKEFLLAHEIMHKKFMHMFRLLDENGKMKDSDIWNKATDAIINANLERDGFTIKQGYVNMPEALNYTADEFYEILLRQKQEEELKKKEQESKQQNDNSKSEEEKSKENNDEHQESEKSENYGDDHSLWEEAFKNYQNPEREGENSEGEKGNEEVEPKSDIDFDEKTGFEENRKEKRKRFKLRREKIEKNIRKNQNQETRIGDIGESKEEIDWKVLIKREIEKTETVWSQRRSIAENNYAYRLEENDIEDEAETEVMIDVSGSVSLDLVKSFLRQLKPLLNQSKLRIGCFNEKFWGFVDINSIKDIENFIIPPEARGGPSWTEDWDLAVRSFTKKREINKIVFTDGYPSPGTMPKEDLKRENVIWLVYGNKDFAPCCGKVINITQKQLERLNIVDQESSIEEERR